MSAQGEQCQDGFLGSNGQFPSICPLHQRRAELVRLRLGLHDTESRGQQCEVVGVGRHVEARDGAVQHKMFKEGWGDDGSMWDPRIQPTRRRRLFVVAGLDLQVGQIASPHPEWDLRDHTFTSTIYSSHSPFHCSGAQDRWSATLLPIRSHPLALHEPSPLTFPPLHPPLSLLSFTSRRSALSSSQRASFTTFSVFLSRRGLSLIQALSKTHAQSVVIGFTPVGSPFYAWCATNGPTTAALGFTPQQTMYWWLAHWSCPTCSTSVPPATLTREPGSSNLERTRSTLLSGDSLFHQSCSSTATGSSTATQSCRTNREWRWRTSLPCLPLRLL